MTNDDKGGITMGVLRELISSIPAEVDILIVGGQAMMFWQGFFQDLYPEAFENIHDVAFGTQDIDFVVKDFQAAEACAKAWWPRVAAVYKPKPDDVTPNIAVVELNLGGPEPVIIDFLNKWAYPTIKNRYVDYIPVEMKGKALKVLGVRAVLLSKIGNILIVRRYGEVYVQQVRGAMLLLRLAITRLLDTGNHEAYRNIGFVLDLAKASRIGSEMLFKHGVDLLECIPMQHPSLDPTYRQKTLKPAMLKIANKRQQLQFRLEQSLQRRGLSR